MASRYHSTSHLGRGGIELTGSPLRMTVTLADLETLAFEIAAKHQVAMFHGNDTRLTEYERQLTAVAEYANDLAAVMR